MASAGAIPSMDPLAPGGPKFFGRGGSCCRHYWIKYSHKHAKLTEKKYLLSRWGLFSWWTGINTTFDSKIVQKLEILGKYAQNSIFLIISLFLSFWQALVAIFWWVSSIKFKICSNLRLRVPGFFIKFPWGYGSECPKIGHSIESINLSLRLCLIYWNLHAKTHILKQRKVRNSNF